MIEKLRFALSRTEEMWGARRRGPLLAMTTYHGERHSAALRALTGKKGRINEPVRTRT
jgi:hypothetical protein